MSLNNFSFDRVSPCAFFQYSACVTHVSQKKQNLKMKTDICCGEKRGKKIEEMKKDL